MEESLPIGGKYPLGSPSPFEAGPEFESPVLNLSSLSGFSDPNNPPLGYPKDGCFEEPVLVFPKKFMQKTYFYF